MPDSHGRGESPPVRVWHCETACKRSFFNLAKKFGRPEFWSGHDLIDPTGSAGPVKDLESDHSGSVAKQKRLCTMKYFCEEVGGGTFFWYESYRKSRKRGCPL